MVAKCRIGIWEKESIISVQWFQKIPTLGSTFLWETRQASFPTGMVVPWVEIFLSPPNTNDGLYLSPNILLPGGLR